MPAYRYRIRLPYERSITGDVHAPNIQDAAEKVARRHPEHRSFRIWGPVPGTPEVLGRLGRGSKHPRGGTRVPG